MEEQDKNNEAPCIALLCGILSSTLVLLRFGKETRPYTWHYQLHVAGQWRENCPGMPKMQMQDQWTDQMTVQQTNQQWLIE